MLPEREREFIAMQGDVDRLKKDLYGNGQPGIIQTLAKRLGALERNYYIALGIVAALQFLTGSGILSLKGLLGK